MRTWGSKAAIGVALLVLLGGGASGCSEDEKVELPRFVPPGSGEPEGLIVTPRTLPPIGAGGTITLKGGGEIHTIMIDGRRYVPIESTFSEQSWQAIVGQSVTTGGADTKDKRDAAVKAEIDQLVAKISKHARVVGVDALPSVGWASAFVPLDSYDALAGIAGIGHRVLVNPVVSTPIDRARRDMTKDKDNGFQTQGALSSLEDLVGLSRMGIDEFNKQALIDLHGYTPDGSHVTIGITDTGITYAHPAFRDLWTKPRIDSMRDFTGEGRIFFTAAGAGRFEITPATAVPLVGAQNEALTLTADFLVSPNDVYDSPDPSKLETIEAKTILVDPTLKALLTAPNASGARFGVLSEPAFGTSHGGVDLDHNGKTDDRFYAILIPGQGNVPDAVWISIGGVKGDFRKSPRLTSFDLAHETFAAYSEKVGLDIKKETILDGTGADVPVTTAAIVGFDPGNHGSHVAGIASARKIIENHPDNTKLHGVAPAARIASGRVCANTGGCRATKAITELSNAGAHVINMSIGSLGPENDGYGVQEAVIDRLTVQNGTVFVIAASNDGPGRQTVGSPSVSRYGISVAATASPTIIQAQYHWPGSGKSTTPVTPTTVNDDYLLYFSSRGPTSAGGMKPDISAPGTWLSAIQLNAAPGSASGLDVMWGTSMASPAMAGAVALLLDAAKVYNMWNPDAPLALDGRTIRRVLLASARPFDVTSLDTHTLEAKKGQYTWVDEGFGMVNLQRAWEMLKKEREMRAPAPIASFGGPAGKTEIPLDYQVRVLRVNPNGIAYDGTKSVEGTGDAPEPKLGRGLWLDAKDTQSLFRVQVARRLPSDVMTRPDIGDLALQVKTTADEFELETTIHGSHVQWVRPGVQNGLDCAATPIASIANATLPHMLVVGEGATDVPVNPTTGAGGSIAQTTSVMHVCVDRALVDLLPPGDHGAIVSAYRVIGSAREAVPTFTVPIYITVPHKTLAGPAGLHISSSVESFGVARHYVDVPKGTTIVKLTLEVPEATLNGTAVTGCSGVELQALEGGNTATPPELVKNPSDAYVQNCGSTGKIAPTPDWRKLVITRPAPTAGIWDLHIFGLYAFKTSHYTLDVEFAKVTSTKNLLTGAAADLATSFDVSVVDASYPLVISAQTSTFTVTGFAQERTDKVAEKAKLRVAADAAGTLGRSYSADIASVTISTSKSTGNDLDLEILECDDAQLLTCKSAGTSGGPKDDESVTFTPKAGKLYVAVVEGYSIKANEGAFTLREELGSTKPEKGTLTIATSASGKTFSFATTFDATASLILADARYTSGAYAAVGSVDVKDDGGTLILRIPVSVHIP